MLYNSMMKLILKVCKQIFYLKAQISPI